ncbi:hypothetical protein OKA04_03845 [Luteolibacter flavescens]|uniref:DUF4034 domain-containing protein n=1 Tax=Luteolibacter flavescens TaxID=1859460 RepID=A0ABT3FJW8_9BACT|nr:hypothetical protein [Luteolibacter flavescens]MCW1883845.1 hypothetical protein [Luteolibacter flavescens]
MPLALTAGFAIGFGSRHLGGEQETPAGEASVQSRHDLGGMESGAGAALPKLKSTDTVESLLALDDASLYRHLALWLLDADERQMQAFLQGYDERSEADDEVLKLLFARWTKLNPQGALDAAKSDDTKLSACWWAWAMNDPETAVREVPGEFFDDVMQSLARFHPQRVKWAIEAHPEHGDYHMDFEQIAMDLAATDPAGALLFLRKRGGSGETEVIERWTREDPHSALAWLEEHPDRTGGDFEEEFIETLEEAHPELLAELAARSRSGMLKWQLERAAFAHLSKSDPAAALEMARSTDSPRIKAERLALLGHEMIAGDPRQALARFDEVFQTLPDALNRISQIRYSDGGTDTETVDAIAGVGDFIEGLVAADPRATMDVASRHGVEVMARVGGKWASENLEDFSGWLSEQPPGPLRDRGKTAVARRLSSASRYADALQSAGQIEDEDSRTSLRVEILIDWKNAEPAAADAWIDGAELSESELDKFDHFMIWR